ncbi:hypothetical protein GCM10022252_79310 [Streptosporangium oxazolinicum]|uniref:Integrase catalytic domain-containing protein n=1 Tax=Streptosporangium oxazolinicum TaxID=909287 RepID=A0ABP8BN25_9ACTN
MPDLLDWDFTADAPGLKHIGDITYLPVGDGEFLYLATVLDCFSRRVVGWSIATHMRTELVSEVSKRGHGSSPRQARSASAAARTSATWTAARAVSDAAHGRLARSGVGTR